MSNAPIRNNEGDSQPCSMTIEVTGEGHVNAAPDRAVVALGIRKEGEALQELQKEGDGTMSDVIEALLGLGVPREQIATQTYSIEPQYDYVDGQQKFRGYSLTHLLQITLDDTAQAGVVIDTAVSSGANHVAGITFTVADSSPLQQLALAEAVRNAGDKASAIAGAMGVAISAVPCRVEETQRFAQPAQFKLMAVADSAASPIEPGQLTFTASIRAWYLFA